MDDHGLVYSLRFGKVKIMKIQPASATWKYPSIQLTKDGVPKLHRVHELVAKAFLGPPPTPKHEPNHKNGIKSDNRAENLEWVTRSENIKHAYMTGLRGQR